MNIFVGVLLLFVYRGIRRMIARGVVCMIGGGTLLTKYKAYVGFRKTKAERGCQKGRHSLADASL